MTSPTLAALLLSALAMTAIVAVRYVAASGLFAWLTARRARRDYAGLDAQIRREIGWSLASAAIYGVPAAGHRLGLATTWLDADLCRSP
jgi:hypothetical protein